MVRMIVRDMIGITGSILVMSISGVAVTLGLPMA
jgi:hypothetical protein